MPQYLIVPNTDNRVATGDLNGDGTVTIGELMTSTAIITGLLVIISNLIVQSLLAWLFPRAAWIPWLIATSILATIAGGGLGIWRMLRYEMGLHYWLDDRNRNRTLEDQDRNFRMGLTDQDRQERITQADIDDAVWQMLNSHYKTGRYTRGSIPGLSEPRWNAGNRALRSAGLRRGRATTIHADTLDEAWAQYLTYRRNARQHYLTTEGELIAK